MYLRLEPIRSRNDAAVISPFVVKYSLIFALSVVDAARQKIHVSGDADDRAVSFQQADHFIQTRRGTPACFSISFRSGGASGCSPRSFLILSISVFFWPPSWTR